MDEVQRLAASDGEGRQVHPTLNLYYISWSEGSWDTYDSAVVCAESEEDAKSISPMGTPFEPKKFGMWAEKLEDISVQLIGIALPNSKRGVECSSFNAG